MNRLTSQNHFFYFLNYFLETETNKQIFRHSSVIILPEKREKVFGIVECLCWLPAAKVWTQEPAQSKVSGQGWTIT